MYLKRKVFTFCKTLLFPDLSRIHNTSYFPDQGDFSQVWINYKCFKILPPPVKEKLKFKNLSFSLTGGGKMAFPKKTP